MGYRELPDNIDEIIERKVEERVQKELDYRSNSQEGSCTNFGSESSVSRRGFLKTIGFGAGALTLSSLVSGWSILQPQSDGLSDINADKVDGLNANELGAPSSTQSAEVFLGRQSTRSSSTSLSSSTGSVTLDVREICNGGYLIAKSEYNYGLQGSCDSVEYLSNGTWTTIASGVSGAKFEGNVSWGTKYIDKIRAHFSNSDNHNVSIQFDPDIVGTVSHDHNL